MVTKIWGKMAVLMNSKKKNPPAPNINPVKSRNAKLVQASNLTLMVRFPKQTESFKATGGVFSVVNGQTVF